nr:uncharacterized mitochondrial protein AtMg00810-like [Tanacetum cinerariifolium]
MEQPNPIFAKILILDTRKFEQWKFRIQQYLQNKQYALWEVIEFGDSYEAPQEVSDTGSASEGSAKKKGKTVVVTTKDMLKRRNDVKARTTLLLALPDEHQLRFSKYKTAQELWAIILKTFGGNEATKMTKKNKLKQYLAPEWLMYTIVWRNRSDLDTMSLDDLYNHLKVYELEVQKKSESNSHNMAFISLAKNSSEKEEVNTTSIPTASTQVSPTSANVAAASISHDTACAYIASQSNGSQIKYADFNQIDKDDIKEMDIKQGLKEEESAPKALMAIDRVGWDWSYMANEEENHALVPDEEAPTEFSLMTKSSSDNEIRGLEFEVESKDNKIKRLTKELEELKKEKEGLDRKLTSFQSASKDLDTLLGSQSGCSRHMTGNISYLSDYEPYNGGYVSFRQGGGKITGKGVMKTDHLGKFDLKGDEGYFNGYSMSRKAFRVFIKRTKRVEENLHVDFLENKLIEKGAGPNWLFNIDTLTNFMNYVPVMVAVTSSTNFSGTKDDASQDVKKDVSSLRYIALPNCGNSNPTATSKHLPTDQIETLTMETPIPTVSSPIPNACLNDSPEPSSDTRLISKRVTSQDDTPSMDNILTFLNRFEDTLGVTKNTGDTNGVEADLGNMEHNILASPTPTFRIYKYHPKSQIIGPVDTSEEPKKISDAFKVPSWVEAMQEELLQFKIQNVWTLVDCPEGDPEFPARVYKVEKAMYGLHQAHRACLKVLQKKDGIFLSQDKYVGDILKKFRYSDVRSANTPMDKENPWGKYKPGKVVDLHLYRSMIGSLMYLTASRPDIIFAVCACVRHQVTPKECHPHAVKRIFRYLKSHPKLGIWYPKDSPFDLVAYSDSDYGGTTQDRKSTTGGCQFLGKRLISWQCKKQTIVATSTTEAEYVAAASGCGQVLWIQNQLLDYGLAFCDYHNMIAILEKYEHNVDFHQIVDFVEASHIRIKTTDEGTKILATMDGKFRTISESSIRRNLKLNDKAGISSLPDAELFKNLALMGYTILPNQKFTFQKVNQGEGSGTPAEPHHTPTPEAQQSPQHDLSSSIYPPVTTETIPTLIPTEIPTVKQYSKRARIAQSSALPTAADESASPLGDDSQGETFPTISGLEGRSLETGEEAGVEKSTERGSNDTEELVNILTSLDAASILTSRVQVVSIPPAAKVFIVGIPTGSGMVPNDSPIFTTASMVTPYSRRKGKEKMVESDTSKKKKLQEQMDVQMAREMEEQLARKDQRMNEQIAKDAEIARIHAEKELQILIDGLDRNNETIAKLAFYDYHNMIAILEKYEHNVDFPQIVDFVQASHIWYALTINPTVYVSHIRQFWSTTRIETTDEGTKILATVDDEPASLSVDVSQGEAFPTVSGLEAGQDRENIIKTSALPYNLTPRVTSLATDEGSIQQQLNELTDLCTHLQRKQSEMATKFAAQEFEIASLKARLPSGEDATIKGRSLETGEDAGVEKSTERGSNDTEELLNVFNSLDETNILTSRVQVVSVPPAVEVSTVSIPTGSGLVPTAKYQRRDEQIPRDTKIARIHAEEELQMLIDGLDRNNETIPKYLEEYEQFAVDLSIREKIDMINELVKYQDHYAKLVPVEEVYVEALQVKHLIIDWEIHTEGKRDYWKIIRLGGHTVVYQFFVDMLKHFNREDLLQLWTLVKETLSIRQATSDKEKKYGWS